MKMDEAHVDSPTWPFEYLSHATGTHMLNYFLFYFLHASPSASSPSRCLSVVVLYLQAVGNKEWREVSEETFSLNVQHSFYPCVSVVNWVLTSGQFFLMLVTFRTKGGRLLRWSLEATRCNPSRTPLSKIESVSLRLTSPVQPLSEIDSQKYNHINDPSWWINNRG